MKIITIETLKAFLDELNKKYGTEFYSKQEIDEKLKSSGGSVDYQELARRIPSWQWKVTLPKSENQTVTATVGSKTYTDDFYAPQGSQITFSAKADVGYIAGSVSPTRAMLTGDLTTVTVTAAVSEEVEAGSKTFELNSGDSDFYISQNVQVVKLTWNGKDTYVKIGNRRFLGIIMTSVGDGENSLQLVFASSLAYADSVLIADDENEITRTAVVASWSTEINEHAVDIDLTRY